MQLLGHMSIKSLLDEMFQAYGVQMQSLGSVRCGWVTTHDFHRPFEVLFPHA